MEMSEQIHEIATAMAKAQADMKGAVKDSANPFFKSKYAALDSVWDACRQPLTSNGIAVFQSPSTDGARVSVVTLLTHLSGQWIKSTLTVTAKDDSPQSVGSCISYLRRYALQSLVGVAAEDDDGEAAHGRVANGNGQQSDRVSTRTIPTPPKGYLAWLDDMQAAADEGTEQLQKAWKESKADYRSYLTTHAPKQWEAMKAAAAKVSEPVSA